MYFKGYIIYLSERSYYLSEESNHLYTLVVISFIYLQNYMFISKVISGVYFRDYNHVFIAKVVSFIYLKGRIIYLTFKTIYLSSGFYQLYVSTFYRLFQELYHLLYQEVDYVFVCALGFLYFIVYLKVFTISSRFFCANFFSSSVFHAFLGTERVIAFNNSTCFYRGFEIKT